MSGETPEIYWYLLWVGVLAWAVVFSVSMMAILSRGQMKKLELLKAYVEKGIDPPPALAALLATPCGKPGRRWKTTPPGADMKPSVAS